MRSDHELLDAWRAGDLEAGGALYERYFDSVCWFFRNKVSSGVEDLVQATFLACVEARERLREDSSFRGLLFTVARRQLVDRIRKANRGGGREEHLSIAELEGSPSAVLTKREEQKLLVHALRRLPLDHQILLELHYWERLTGPELAEVLDVPEGTVRTRLRRARALLADALQSLEDPTNRVESTLTDLDGWARSIRPQGNR